MKPLLEFMHKQAKLFEKGGKLALFYPMWEALDTFLFTPGQVTDDAPHVRDAGDLKRLMTTVVIALAPCMLMAMYNTGYQAHLAIQAGCQPLDNWQTALMQAMGLPFSPANLLACFLHGALYYLPIYIVTLTVGGLIEVAFSIVRKHDVNEGFLVTSALFPLTLPATIPLWQVALGIAFGVIFGKEVFGGTGMNIFNPALVSRAFLYFAYPAYISGDKAWIAAQTKPDAYSGATWLSVLKEQGLDGFQQGLGPNRPGLTWWDSFLGFEPGSMGETSMLLILIGAAIIVFTRVASWRVIAGCFAGSAAMSIGFNLLHMAGVGGNYLAVPFWWHWVLGGFAFGAVFMATDPVSSPFTERGKWIYGMMIGAFGVMVRTLNPAYPESWMLAILFMNMFAPLIDHFVVRANIKRRMARYAA